MIKCIIIFDLDDVLIHEGFDPPIAVSEAEQVLQYIKYRLYMPIALASYNENAHMILQMLKWSHYFDIIVCGPNDTACKKKFIKRIAKRFNAQISECILFDDLEDNVKAVKDIKCYSYLVDYENGISMEYLQDCISDFLISKNDTEK